MNEFQELVKEIAGMLEGWEYKPHATDYSNARFEQIATSYGATIILRSQQYTFDRETGRLEVSGKYPTHGRHRYHSSSWPRITVAAKRGAAAIAKDIERRFLPKYLPLYAEAITWVHQKVVADERDAANLTAIAEVLGASAPKPDSKQVRLLHGRNQPGGYFDASYDGTFHVELHSVPLEMALAIAQILIRR